MPEPIAVAFVEVVPETAGFKAATEAQLRSQLRATQFVVPPAAGAARGTQQLRTLAAAEAETTSAQTLLTSATEKYNAALVAGAGVESRVAKAHLQHAAAADADAEAQRALFAVTEETDAATVQQIDSLVADTAALNVKAAAEERAAIATRTHGAASVEATDAILAETASVTGLRGASIGVNPAFLAATAGAIAFFESLKQASDFEEQMHLIQFATHATGAEMKQVEEESKALGKAIDIPGASATDAATAISDLTRSGQTLTQAEKDARDALLLSSAAQEDLATSTKDIVVLLRAYNLTAAQAGEVTDALTAATNTGAGSADEWASALKTAAPVAAALGLNIRETTTLLIQMAQGGVQASQAGSLLRLGLTRLTSGTKPVNEELKKLKVSIRDAEGNVRPDVFLRLGLAIQQLPPAERAVAAAQLFTARTGSRLLPILLQSADAYDKARQSAHQQGITLREAEARQASFGGQTRELRKDLSDLGVTIGELVAGPAAALILALRVSVRAINEILSPLVDLENEVTGLAKAAKEPIDIVVNFIPHIPGTGGGGIKGFVGSTLSGLAHQAAGGIPVVGEAGATIERIKGAAELGGRALEVLGLKEHSAAEKGKELKHSSDDVAMGLQKVAGSADIAGGSLKNATDQMTNLTHASAVLDAQLLKEQTTGASRLTQIGTLQQDIAVQRARIAQAQAGPAKGRATTIRNAREKILADQAEIESLQGQIQSDAQAAAQKAKDHRDKIRAAQESQDQALIDSISSRQQVLEQRVSQAQADSNIRAEEKADRTLRHFFAVSIQHVEARIRQVRAEGRSTKELAAELQSLRLAKQQVTAELKRLAIEDRQQREQTRIESAQLDVDLASITSSQSDAVRSTASINREIAARQRLIAALKKAQSDTKRGTVAWKQLRNQIAEQRQAIADLKKERGKQQQDVESFRKQEFQFLTEQQGFASQLAGNLLSGAIPTTTATGGGVSTLRVPPIRPPSTAAAAQALRERANRGATAGQMTILISAVNKTNALLNDLKAGVGHPEARSNRVRTRHVTETSVD